ncbi:MAG TPA: nuclear transport factor 2 family protein [Pyrinomonadaceae bacterium]|nr:nuclear transport factor 2 family protein [Pyrinomonadaceae bacterium]
MKEENIKAVEAYLNALKQKDLNLAPFADDLKFFDPIAGSHSGAENFEAFLAGFLPAITDVRVISHVCEDDFVVTHFEVDGVFGIIPILEKFRVENGKITEAFGFFDPRPILGSS